LLNIRVILPLVSVLTISSAYSQELAYSHRLSNTATFLGSLEKVGPVPPAVGKGSVLVVFRTSEQGIVISAKALMGSPEFMQSALDVVNQWKFKPTSINGGQLVQMNSAVVIDFSQSPPAIHAPKPMTAEQLSPNLQFKCLNGLLHQESSSLEACKQQLRSVEQSSSLPMDLFTAQDEYGLALLNYSQGTKQAIEHFSQAIQVASEKLKPSDAEWSYAYWHRAVAEQRSGDKAEAERDFSTAEESMQGAEKTIGAEKIAAYYHNLLMQIVKQHTTLLESESKNDEPKQVRVHFGQEQ
jgi:tetratricopeptide (TPR) repeat protein